MINKDAWFTSEDFNMWKNHPCTKALFSGFERVSDQAKDGVDWACSDYAHPKCRYNLAHYQGIIKMTDEVLRLTYEDLLKDINANE